MFGVRIGGSDWMGVARRGTWVFSSQWRGGRATGSVKTGATSAVCIESPPDSRRTGKLLNVRSPSFLMGGRGGVEIEGLAMLRADQADISTGTFLKVKSTVQQPASLPARSQLFLGTRFGQFFRTLFSSPPDPPPPPGGGGGLPTLGEYVPSNTEG